MFQRNERERLPLWCVVIVVAFTAMLHCRVDATGSSDDLQAFLMEYGLEHLLAVHLEQQLESASGQDRVDLIHRLSGIYARLLESEQNEELRQFIERRSQNLLATAPDNAADQLRLALLRAPYRRAERIAENFRLRRADEQEIRQALETFDRVIPELQTLARGIQANIDGMQRQLARATDASARVAERQTDQLRSLLNEARFLQAWALYYKALLQDNEQNARDAYAIFRSLLDPERSNVTPSDVSVDLRHLEPIARAILGAALSQALVTSSGAFEWLELLQYDQTHESVRDNLEIWRLAIMLQNEEFANAQKQLETMMDSFDRVLESGQEPAFDNVYTWLRLAAVHALEERGLRSADELAQYVFNKLASMGALDQIVDLARRYGPDALGSAGFPRNYVRGVLAYQEAREMHQDETPTDNPEAIELYRQAEVHLRLAVNDPEAPSFEDAQHICRRLLGLGYYFRADFLSAKEALVEAAAHLPASEAVEALWMAIVAMDKAVEMDASDSNKTEFNRLITEFLNRYPSSQYAPRLVLKRAITEQDASPETVQQLLNVPPSSDVFHAAQSHAAMILYRQFVAADGADRISIGNRFVNVALPLMREDELKLGTNATVNQRYVSRTRQILEVSLTDGIERLTAARAAIDGFVDLRDMGFIDVESYFDEVDYRRVRERLLSNEPVQAQTIAEALWERDSESIWTRLANRALFRHAHEELCRKRLNRQDAGLELAMVIRYGGRVLHEYDDVTQLSNPQVLAYFVAVAEASFEMWERTRDVSMGERALFLYRDRLLTHRPNNGRFLRAAAVLAEAYGDTETALQAWRRLVSGTAQGSDAWFEAKFHLIATLENVDPERARAIMNQHVILYPEYGPNPWGPRLRALDARLPKADESPSARRSIHSVPALFGVISSCCCTEFWSATVRKAAHSQSRYFVGRVAYA